MSWHFSRALVEAYLEESCSAGGRSRLSKSMLTAARSLRRGKTTAACRSSQFGMTSRRLMDAHGAALLMWYRADFLARTSAPQAGQTAKGSAAARNRDCGQRWRASFARFDPDTHSWKIPQLSLFEGLISFSEIWPRWGLMRDGECSVLPILAHDTSVKGSGFLPVIGTPIRSQRSRSQEFHQPGAESVRALSEGITAEPEMGRKTDGLDGWMDSLRALGNGQVPQVVRDAWISLGGPVKTPQQSEPILFGGADELR